MPSSVTSATLQVAGDNYFYAYLNGTLIGSCVAKNCYGAYTSYVIPPASISLPPTDNVLAVYISDSTGGFASGGSWRLTINYANCPTQYVDSNGFCTKANYAGPWGGGPVGGTWMNPGFNDSGWVGAWSGDPDLCGAPCGGTPNPAWAKTLGINWIWGTSTFVAVNPGDGYLFRQIFRAGDPGNCPFSALPTPTPYGTPPATTPTRTRSPTPSVTRTATRTNSPSATFSPTRTHSPTLTRTPSHTPTLTVTPSFTPSSTYTVTLTRTPTPSATPSSTVTQTPSVTATRSHTPSPTASPTATPSRTATLTFSASATLSSSASPTSSFTVTATRTHTPSPTATPSATPSRTVTLTSSASATLTESPSPTPSFTVTVTRTSTPTRTETPSATQTYTVTSTRSETPTPTDTRSPSPTRTLADTATFTPTRSDSPTLSSTPSETLTRTGTVTRTGTPSVTPSFTQSITFTHSPTRTDSPTATPSFTQSITFTHSPSVTPSSTQSVTLSMTPTFTATPTATPSATLSASPSDTPSATPSATRSVTASASPSATPSFTQSVTLTQSPTSSATPSASLTATPSPTPSSSASASRTATPSATPSPSPSASLTATASATASASPTASPSASFSPTETPTFSVSPTFTPQPPFTLSVRVYNSAGEEVALLAQNLGSSIKPEGLAAVQSVVAGAGAPGVLKILGPDLLLSWDGSNLAGQGVAGGLYYVVAELEDAFGKRETWTVGMQVVPEPGGSMVEVYNSAGELVWSSPQSGISDGQIRLSTQQFAPGQAGGLKISYGPGASDFVTWDGQGSQGQAVASGSYVVKITHYDAGGGGQSVSKPVVVLQVPDASPLRLQAAPSPLMPGQRRLDVAVQGLAAGSRAWGEVHSLAGERVAGLSSGPSGLSWELSPATAPGVYLIRVSVLNAQGQLRPLLAKVAVLR